MAVLKVLEIPDPRLQQKAFPIETVDEEVRKLMDDLLETMYVTNGVGLAATQVGIGKRIVVIDVSDEDEEPQPMKLANPELIWQSEETFLAPEGCLSVPEQYADVERFVCVKFQYINEKNEKVQVEADDLLAICIQHEIDHLNGILFIDHLTPLKRKIVLNKLKKARRLAN